MQGRCMQHDELIQQHWPGAAAENIKMHGDELVASTTGADHGFSRSAKAHARYRCLRLRID